MGGTTSRIDAGAQGAAGSMEGAGEGSSVSGDGGGGYVRLVHPRGKVVQVRGPVRAGDVMRSTKHYVTKPNVFRVAPESAVLKPDAILLPGHKFFLVPCSTMVKLVNRHHGFDPSYNAASPSSVGSVTPDRSSACLQLLTKSKPKPPPEKHRTKRRPSPNGHAPLESAGNKQKGGKSRKTLQDFLLQSGDEGNTSGSNPLKGGNRRRLPPRPPSRPAPSNQRPLRRWKPRLSTLAEYSPEAPSPASSA